LVKILAVRGLKFLVLMSFNLKKTRGFDITEDEKEQNRTISKVRIRVEHAIGSVKRYRIVKDKLRNWKCGFRNLVMETCCGLHNFRLSFRPWNYEMAVI